ncbi:hypothetical protein [Anatilimnocola floriformis]|uniref:hypothetical protein n=1 Tax=Anatilimnocola floriformis TaxID=2948575 RepID=UPI0020C5127C|nr:hypothetical protein [Anatilimnocola floriformis]
MKIAFWRTVNPCWAAALTRVPHQIYHTPRFLAVEAAISGGHAEAVLLSDGDDFLFIPYVLRRVEDLPSSDRGQAMWDLQSPSGYGGPLLHSRNEPFLHSALQLWSRRMQERNVVSGFIRLDPLSENFGLESADVGYFCHRGTTISLALGDPANHLWPQVRRQYRSDIQAATAAGLRFRLHEEALPWSDFVRLYRETMQRVGADECCFLTPADVARWEEVGGWKLATVETGQGTIVSAGAFLEYHGTVQHHWQATSRCGLECAATKLLVYQAALHFQQRGNHCLHLGGGMGGQRDSLFQFKSGFSRVTHPYLTWHIPFMPQLYRRLVSERNRLNSRPAQPNFFPSYRCQGVRT